MKTLKVHSVTEYENGKGIKRVSLCAVRESDILGGLASSKQFGSIVLKEGTSLEDAQEAFKEGAELQGVTLGQPDEDGFYRIVPA